MKYRKCLWCGDFFWATHTQVCCCPEHQEARTAEKRRKREAMAREKERRIRSKMEAKLGISQISYGSQRGI